MEVPLTGRTQALYWLKQVSQPTNPSHSPTQEFPKDSVQVVQQIYCFWLLGVQII